jgi:hypothetical protein
MSSVNLKPQQDGSYRGWSSIVGATFAYQAIDDSALTTHDSAATYIRLPRLLGEGGIVSFPFFKQWRGGRPTTVTVRVVAQRVAAAHPGIQIGFVRSGQFAFSGSLFSTGATWTLAVRAFPTDPLTGGAWDESLLAATEVCIKSEENIVGNNDVTLISCGVDYLPPLFTDPDMPQAVSWS